MAQIESAALMNNVLNELPPKQQLVASAGVRNRRKKSPWSSHTCTPSDVHTYRLLRVSMARLLEASGAVEQNGCGVPQTPITVSNVARHTVSLAAINKCDSSSEMHMPYTGCSNRMRSCDDPSSPHSITVQWTSLLAAVITRRPDSETMTCGCKPTWYCKGDAVPSSTLTQVSPAVVLVANSPAPTTAWQVTSAPVEESDESPLIP
mmetsp:Transcript_14849/g.24777  ORF Transcript_14849/g.24777 Transcript_14849/m.24777 type:complete len:206 (-) Transcript_14849:310-927(-)